MTTDLWVVLGNPPGEEDVPSGRMPNWLSRRDLLHAALRREGCYIRFRTWHMLWAALHGSQHPPRSTWARLIADFDFAHLLDSARQPRPGDRPSFRFWNLRWLVDPFTKAAEGKHSVVQKSLLLRQIVCVVETHWSEADAARWAWLTRDPK